MSDAKSVGKRGSAAGGSGAPLKSKDREGGGGKKLCRAAKRAIEKNWEAVSDYVDLLEETKVAISEPKLKGLCVGRVQKPLGFSRFRIIDQEGTECDVGLAGTMKAPKKIDKSDTCVFMGDLVLLDGGSIKGKISAGLARRIQSAYTRLEIRCARGVLESARDSAAAEEVFEWDHSAEEKEAEETLAALAKEKEEFARKWRPDGSSAAARKAGDLL
jgi:hypothetical protein